MKAPDRIWLQIKDDYGDEYQDFYDCTHSADGPVNDTDIEFIRADLVEKEKNDLLDGYMTTLGQQSEEILFGDGLMGEMADALEKAKLIVPNRFHSLKYGEVPIKRIIHKAFAKFKAFKEANPDTDNAGGDE